MYFMSLPSRDLKYLKSVFLKRKRSMNQIIVNLSLLIGDLLCSDSNYKFLQRTNEDDLDYKWEDV